MIEGIGTDCQQQKTANHHARQRQELGERPPVRCAESRLGLLVHHQPFLCYRSLAARRYPTTGERRPQHTFKCVRRGLIVAQIVLSGLETEPT